MKAFFSLRGLCTTNDSKEVTPICYEMKKIVFSIFLLFVLQLSHAQLIQPLSRQDSALVLKNDAAAIEQQNEGNKKEASRHLNNSAMIYWEHNHFEKAVEYYEKSLKLNEELGNENGIAMIHNNLAMIYSDLKQFDKSIAFFNKTLAARRAKKETIGIISALINLSVVLNNQEKYEKSVQNLTEALELARELNDPDQMKSCYGMLSETYEKAGKPEKSFYYFNLYRTFHEMVQNEKIKKTRQELENERLKRALAESQKRNKELELISKNKELKEKDSQIAEFDSTNQSLQKNLTKKELRLRLLTKEAEMKELQAQKEKAVLEAKRLKDRQILWLVIIVLLFVVVVSIVLFKAYRQKNKMPKLWNNNCKLSVSATSLRQQT